MPEHGLHSLKMVSGNPIYSCSPSHWHTLELLIDNMGQGKARTTWVGLPIACCI